MNKTYFVVLIFFLLKQMIITCRSIHRTFDPTIGLIAVNYENDKEIFTLQDIRLQEYPLFRTYKHEYLMSKELPNDAIDYRYDKTKAVSGSELKKIIQNVYEEIKAKKKKFTDFKILKQRDFNKFDGCGLIVLKFKNYPFIFKIFIETPKSFTSPDSKSFQTRGIFVMGGTLRHIVGYTRLKNLDLIKEKIEQDPNWSDKITFPRKWFWIPNDNKWLMIKGNNLGSKKEQQTKIPSIYGIISDEIFPTEKNNTEYKQNYLKLCAYLGYELDPHPNNYLIENKKIALIDTEHFATLIGLNKKLPDYDLYTNYFPNVIGKYIKDKLFTLKSMRLERQNIRKTNFLLFND